jgi:hypothetical protein
MEKFLFSAAPKDCEVRTLPAISAERGAARLRTLRGLAGAQGPKAAQEAGLYLLEDKLALQLKLQGLTLAKGGEVPALSPARWKEGAEEAGVPEHARGLLLDSAQAKRFRAFLRANGAGRGSAGAVDLIHLARHFFYEEPIKVVVPTRNAV